jgi:hypothetical protein
MGSFVRAKNSPVSFALIFRVLSVNSLSAAVWEVVRVLLVVYLSEVSCPAFH